MPKEIKTRTVTKDIKVIDKTASGTAHAKNAFVKSKDTAEETQETRHSSPSEYATDSISGRAKATAQGAAHSAKNRLKNPHQKARHHLDRAKEHFQDVKRKLPKERKKAAEQAKQTAEHAKKNADTLKTKAEQAKKTAEQAKKAATDAKRTLQQTRQAGRQTVGAAKASRQAEKGAKTSAKGMKATGKGTVKSVKKSVKTANRTAKTSVKTAKATAKTAQASAKAAAKSAVVAKKVSIAATKAAIAATKVAAKATIAAAKAAIAAIKGLVALIAAGGWVVVLVIIIICLIGMLVGSVFGIFFSGEDSGTGRSMPDVVQELTTEFYAQVDEIIADNQHDVLDMDAMAINWPEVLAVYAVKVNTDPENPVEVATLDDDKINRLRGVLNDMVSLSHSLQTSTQERTATDENGNETTETETIITLSILFNHKCADEMANEYGFNREQREKLRELLSPEHAELWGALLGGYGGGSGQIGTPDGSRIPKGIFSWPMGEGFRVSSGFGYRTHPVTGRRAFHGGIDIAAPTGTPIFAAADGVVTVANSTDSWGGGFGFFVRIEHEGGYSTLYAHCSRIAVRNGQEVVQGQVIAYVGSTGQSTGPHLHFEVLRNGARFDPMGFFE